MLPSVISYLIGRARSAKKYTQVAFAAMAHRLLEAMHFRGIADDVGRIKNAGLRKLEAEASAAEGDAAKKNAQAAAFANKAIEGRLAILAKVRKESSPEDVAAAMQELEDAVSRLKQFGGQLFLDAKNLRALAHSGNDSKKSPAKDVHQYLRPRILGSDSQGARTLGSFHSG